MPLTSTPRLIPLLLLCYAAAWALLSSITLINDSGIPLKPLGPPAFLDFGIYSPHIADPWGGLLRPLEFAYRALANTSEAWVWLHSQPLKPGPLYPALLKAMGYLQSPLPFTLLWLWLGMGLGLAWAAYLRESGAPGILQLFAACFPALVYYSFLLSTEVLYAASLALLFVCTRQWWQAAGREQALRWAAASIGSLLLALLIRPNALPLGGVVLATLAVRAWRTRPHETGHTDQTHLRHLAPLVLPALLVCTITAAMWVYYLPYYCVHAGNGDRTPYWGLLPSQYHAGLFPQWPLWLNISASELALAGSKLLHAVGLRPSYADLNPWLTLARAAPGLIFLPGLIYGVFKGRAHEQIFVVCVMLPIFVAASQERYLLAITPILLWWGVQAYGRIWAAIRDAHASFKNG
jgi:hypothetical protein